jgi:uncharacterized protein (TIGR03083 family)
MDQPSTDAYLDAIRSNATRLVDAGEAAGLDAPVPTCPDWTVADLLAHIGRVHRWAAANTARTPDEGPARRSDLEMPPGADPVAWAREGAEVLRTALERPATDTCWTFMPPSTIGFWQRRQAHETAMHRVDAESAAGDVHPIDADLAADGIDELLALFAQPMLGQRVVGDGETLHFHCTDVTGEWLVRRTPQGLEITREHAKGDVAARGSASDLLCWLQGRTPVERLEVFGDATLLTSWREAARF